MMARKISQTQISYRDAGTGVDARTWPRRGPAPGDRAPDVILTGPEGQVRLFTLLAASDRFAVLVLPGERANPALAAAAAALGERWPDLLDTYTVLAGASTGLCDANGDLYREYAVRGPELLIVRPDGHIAARAPLARAGAIDELLSRMLCA